MCVDEVHVEEDTSTRQLSIIASLAEGGEGRRGGVATYRRRSATRDTSYWVFERQAEDSDASVLVSFRRGLGDVGYAEGRNVAGFADGRYDRLAAQLTDMTQRKVGVIVIVGSGSTERLLQQVRGSPIPVVFGSGDVVRMGLVASMNRPGGNVTGVSALTDELSGKQLGLLHDLVPKTATIAMVFEPITQNNRIALPEARDAAAAQLPSLQHFPLNLNRGE
jgi:hypothetical protein